MTQLLQSPDTQSATSNSIFEDLLAAPRHRPDLDDCGDGGGTEIVYRLVIVDDGDFEDDEVEDLEDLEDEKPGSSWWAILLGAAIGFSI